MTDEEKRRYLNDIGHKTRKFTHHSCEECDRESYDDWTGMTFKCRCGKMTLKRYSVVLKI